MNDDIEGDEVTEHEPTLGERLSLGFEFLNNDPVVPITWEDIDLMTWDLFA